MNIRLILGWISFFLVSVAVGSAHALDYTDHPLLSAMADFSVRSKDVRAFDVVRVQPDEIIQARGIKYNGPLSFEGKVTELKYVNTDPNAKHSIEEILRNYNAAIEKLGGRQLNSTPQDNTGRWHVFAVEGAAGRGPVSILLDVPYEYEYYLTIVEHKAMAQTVQAGQLAKEISSAGFATLYINFDTNQAVLKEDGIAAVKEIGLLMKQTPQLKLAIEGHTDNVGRPADNKKLSQARSESVLKAVVAQGIDAKRLSAVGRGQESPIADNRNEAGRAKNRRVELVKQN